jgi:hypothetical protein
VGDVVFKRSPTGETIATKCPDKSDPKVRAIYEKIAKRKKRQPFRIAVSDYFKGKNLLAKK